MLRLARRDAHGARAFEVWTDALPQRNCGRFARPSLLLPSYLKERVTESRKLRMNSVSTVLCQVTNRAAVVSGRAHRKDIQCPGIPLRRIRVQGAVRSLRGVRHPILVVDLEGKSRIARSAELRLRTCGGEGVRMA